MAALRTYSKSLSKAARSSGGHADTPQLAGGGDIGAAAVGSQRPTLSAPAAVGNARGTNKRKAPSPTASCTDLESLERVLVQQQQQQAARTQADAASGVVAAFSGRQRRHAAQAAGQQEEVHGTPSPPLPPPRSTAEVRFGGPGPVPRGGLSAAAAGRVLPPSHVEQPYSPLKIAPLQNWPLPVGPAPVPVTTPQPLLIWPHSSPSFLSPPPAVAQSLPTGKPPAHDSLSMLTPAVASRAARELASIESVLRVLTSP